MPSIPGTDSIAHWAYEERISAHAQPAVKCELFYMYNLCWAYAERILSHTEHTRNEFHRMPSIPGTDLIACWARKGMLKSRISLPIRIRFFFKNLVLQALGTMWFRFLQKEYSKKKISCPCTPKELYCRKKVNICKEKLNIICSYKNRYIYYVWYKFSCIFWGWEGGVQEVAERMRSFSAEGESWPFSLPPSTKLVGKGTDREGTVVSVVGERQLLL
jgi:hypothetical protein